MAYVLDASGFDAVVSKLDRVWESQIPFAISRTINALAYQTQRDTIERLLPQRFFLRNDWWRPGRKTGVNYFPSNKRQTPIQARVNTLAWFMQKQEEGGVKTPAPGQAWVPIPTRNAQPSIAQPIRTNRTFKALVQGKKAGSMTLAHKGSPWIHTLKTGKPSIAVRLTNDRLPIAVMYIGVDRVIIKPRFGFRANAAQIVRQNLNQIFATEFQNAIATAK